MRTTTGLPWILCAALAGCASTPSGPPEEIAPKIVALLDEGKADDAAELFESAARSDEARDQLYPLLFETARARYEKGEATGSTLVLRFMAEQYPRSGAVDEALVYALFLERAGTEKPTSEQVQELGKAIEHLREGTSEAPAWVELVQAQQAIDRGDLDAARQAYARFQAEKKATSPQLTVYVEDIDRYLRSNP